MDRFAEPPHPFSVSTRGMIGRRLTLIFGHDAADFLG
jgi:hypothetical protein